MDIDQTFSQIKHFISNEDDVKISFKRFSENKMF